MTFHRFPSLRTAIAAAALAVAALPAAHAASIFGDTFDAENGTNPVLNYGSFAQWDVTDGTVDLIGNGYFDFYPGNGLFIDLDGSTGNAGTMTTKSALALGPGTYTLSFDLGNNGGGSNTMDVALGSVFAESFTRAAMPAFEKVSRTFTVASGTSAYLSFAQFGADNQGLVIDNVDVSRVVPEPSTYALSALGLLAAGALVRRRKGARNA